MTDQLNAAEAIREHLYAEPGDRTARLLLADLYEDEGRPAAAGVQRELAGMGLYRDLDASTRAEILAAAQDYDEQLFSDEADVIQEWDEELSCWTFTVRTTEYDDETYIISAKRGDLLARAYRRVSQGV